MNEVRSTHQGAAILPRGTARRPGQTDERAYERKTDRATRKSQELGRREAVRARDETNKRQEWEYLTEVHDP